MELVKQGDFSFIACREISKFLDLTFQNMMKESHLWEKLYDLPYGTSFCDEIPPCFQGFYDTYFIGHDIRKYDLAMRCMQRIVREGWEEWVAAVRRA
jgi:hypothetical protein